MSETNKELQWKDMYKKYRPIQLSDVVGQSVVVKSLINAAKRDSFNHAHIFAGSFGSGKTSLARILASLIVCPNRKPNSIYACGKCKYCQGIHDGHCIDVIEINGSNQTGVDEARELEKNASFTPQELAKKIYIIDECHKLSDSASNALLKIMEEPPPYVTFILCTTEYNKILGTILSRCQRHRLTKIPTALMAERLDKIAAREGIQLETGASSYIARISDGSLRDAIGNLEQVAVFSEGKISLGVVSEFFGIPGKRATYEMVQMIVSNNISGLLAVINDLVMSSVQPKEILSEVSNVLRNLFIMKCCGNDGKLMDVNSDEVEILEKTAASVSVMALKQMADSLSNVDRRVSIHINERWIVEAALVHCASIVNAETQRSIK